MQRFRCKPLASITDIRGKERLLYGVSVADVAEFGDRIDSIRSFLQSHADSSETIESLFAADCDFAADCRRVLQLNGVKLHWIRAADLAELLVASQAADGALQAGLLIRINCATSPVDSKQSTYAEVVASLAEYTQSIAEAVELTQMMNAEQLNSIMSAIGDKQTGSDKPKQAAMQLALERLNDTTNSDQLIEIDAA
jgi:hypothetical protein